jgi:hypothetical protein
MYLALEFGVCDFLSGSIVPDEHIVWWIERTLTSAYEE